MKAELRYGILQAAVKEVVAPKDSTTVGQQIEELLKVSGDPRVNKQIGAALMDPNSIIEIRSGEQVQTVNKDMPLRELVTPETGAVEITVSQPHVGG